MDSFSTFACYSATVKFTAGKSCFFTVPGKWVKDIVFKDDAVVFKVEYGEMQEKHVFVSCYKGVMYGAGSESTVYINQKFAEILGIKENDTVILQPLFSNISKAESVVLEPLTSDDWEIMETNAQYIEENLMNQIRVVSRDQTFPLWIRNCCIYSKVVSCEPDCNPVVLHKNSELRIVPKDRHGSSSSLLNSTKAKKKSNYLQFQSLRTSLKSGLSDKITDSNERDEILGDNFVIEEINLTRSLAFYAPNFITHWFAAHNDKPSSDESEDTLDEIFEFNFDSILRVLPYTNPKLSLPRVVQATTVFISASTYVSCCGDSDIPPCFVATLEKFSLPGKKQRKGNDSIIKNSNQSSDNNSLSKTGNGSRNDSNTSKDSSVSEQKPFNSICVTVMVVKSLEEDEFNLPFSLFMYKNAIVVPKELKRALSLEVASLVNLKSVHTKPMSSYSLIFHPLSQLSSKVDEMVIYEQFYSWAFGNTRKQATFVISDGTLVKLKIRGRKSEFFIHLQEKESSKNSSLSSPLSSLESNKVSSFKSDNCNYIMLTLKALKKTAVKIGAKMCETIYVERPYLLKEGDMYCDSKLPKLSNLGGLSELMAKAMEDIAFWLKLRPLAHISNHSSTYSGCILICGPKGVGKSSFANVICKKYSSYPFHVSVSCVPCLPLKGKRIETLAKRWDDIASEAIYSQPSIILFEDLDYIASAPISHEQENGPEGIYSASISQAFVNLMNRITASESNVVVIVTSQSLHSLHSSLVNTKGRHIFQSILEVNPPNAKQRTEILMALLYNKPHISRNTLHHINAAQIAAKTEGFVAQDLSILVDRATHAAWIRLTSLEGNSAITLKTEDFDIALKGLIPSSLQGISLQIQDQRTWNDVGGLNNVKKVIQQIIMWPTKYKEIFKNYSLKPQTNILLYGAPGTGKTLLAGVVANECGLNFISIKGPELLSKYIGASEQAVRDLFKRATTARPCILFFDEFDSIAPRRGHDSTGVTDRVVNQLLTQLDGVESLEGVHVLAATSRPELIDPALLRPGRLDKCLLCSLPDKNERVEILNCLSSKLPLCDDIDFDSIATLTANFSGADLQALLYSAHIEALHEIQNSPTKRYTTSDDSDYRIASDKLLFLPSLEEGLKTPLLEDGKKIIQDVAVVHDNVLGSHKTEPRRRSTLSVTITQRHLLKVASEMKPSVSLEERLRYELIFKNFQNVLSGEAPVLPENAKKVTLA